MDNDELIAYVEDLAPSDLKRVLLRFPDATSHLPDNASHLERVEALIRYIRSKTGPRMGQLREVVRKLFPDINKDPIPDEVEQQVALPSPKPVRMPPP